MRTKERTGTTRFSDGGTEDGRLAVSLSEAAAVLGIGRSSAYAAAKSGDLPVLKVGGRLLVSVAELQRMLSGNASAHR